MNTTPQREFGTANQVSWSGCGPSRRGKVARLALLTHQLGWELRIESGDLLMTQACRSDREIEGCFSRLLQPQFDHVRYLAVIEDPPAKEPDFGAMLRSGTLREKIE